MSAASDTSNLTPAQRAALLAAAGADNAVVITGPLAKGAARHGPYDVITVQGGVQVVPDALLAQLKEGGRIGCLFMEGALGAVRIGHMHAGKVTWRYAFNAAAPVLPGFAAEPAFVL